MLNKFEYYFSHMLSVLFHPLLMAFYGLGIVFYLDTYLTLKLNYEVKMTLLLVFFTSTVLLPSLIIYFLYKLNIIENVQLKQAQDRKWPYLITAFIYSIVYFLFLKINLPSLLYYILLGATLAIILTAIITVFWKISAHAVGIGGLLGMILGLCYRLQLNEWVLVSILFLVAGSVGFARLKLQAHTPWQVYAGYLLGFTCEFAIIYI